MLVVGEFSFIYSFAAAQTLMILLLMMMMMMMVNGRIPILFIRICLKFVSFCVRVLVYGGDSEGPTEKVKGAAKDQKTMLRDLRKS